MCLVVKEWGFSVCSKHVLLSALSHFILVFSSTVMSLRCKARNSHEILEMGWSIQTGFQWWICFYFLCPPPIQVLQSFLSLSLMLSLLCPWELEVALTPACPCNLTGWFCPLLLFPGAHTSCSSWSSCFWWLETTHGSMCRQHMCAEL